MFSLKSLIIKSIILANNPTIIEILETSFSKNMDLSIFFLLMEEKVKRKIDISNCKKLFLSEDCFNIKYIERYMEISNEHYISTLNDLLKIHSTSNICTYLAYLLNNKPLLISEIIDSVIDKCDNFYNFHYYINLIIFSSNFDINIFPSLKDKIHFKFYNDPASITFHSDIIALWGPTSIFKYCNYLSSNIEEFNAFEKDILSFFIEDNLVKYATHVPSSNKRKILSKLIANKDFYYTKIFIDSHPEYKIYAPMI